MNEVDLGYRALAGVAVASVAAAILFLLALRRWSDQDRLKRLKSQAQAHLLEFRLFMDDPVTILRSQRDLIADNLRIVGLLLKPMVLAALPTLVLLWQLDALYSRAPLRAGEPATVSCSGSAESLQTPDGVLVETRPIHIRATGETCWRIRPTRAVSGRLRAAGAEARVIAAGGIAYLPLPLTGNDRIVIGYPKATVLGLHWLVWFLLLSTLAGFVLRRPLRVVF